VSVANAELIPRAHLRLARLIVEDGWSISPAAKMFRVSWPTAKRWADRFAQHGKAGMQDRSSRPHYSPNKTPEALKRRIIALRWRKRLGPVQIAGLLGVAPSTVHAVLVRCRVNRPSYITRKTGEPVHRYEHEYPGSTIHVDVTKFGNIPDGGGHRFAGRQQGGANRSTTARRTGTRNARHAPRLGTSFVDTVIDDTVIDDNSRVAYAEICSDEKADTAVGVLQRAVAWFAKQGVIVERALSDNGSAYKAHAWRDACTELGITPKRTRPYRPQTNGKIERFHRTLSIRWITVDRMTDGPPRHSLRRSATYRTPPGGVSPLAGQNRIQLRRGDMAVF
jgi:transposase InsO family protein